MCTVEPSQDDAMITANIKFQKRSHTAAVTIPQNMVAGLPENVVYFSAKQYDSGKIMLTPIPGVVEK